MPADGRKVHTLSALHSSEQTMNMCKRLWVYVWMLCDLHLVFCYYRLLSTCIFASNKKNSHRLKCIKCIEWRGYPDRL